LLDDRSVAPIPAQAPGVDPFADPARFDGVLLRRTLAYIVDIIIIWMVNLGVTVVLVLLGLASFGLLFPLLLTLSPVYILLPFAYHTLTIGGPKSATLGMQFFDLEVRVWHGGKPGYIQALLHTLVFYASISLTAGLILILPIFHNRSRCLQDILCGTFVLRR